MRHWMQSPVWLHKDKKEALHCSASELVKKSFDKLVTFFKL